MSIKEFFLANFKQIKLVRTLSKLIQKISDLKLNFKIIFSYKMDDFNLFQCIHWLHRFRSL